MKIVYAGTPPFAAQILAQLLAAKVTVDAVYTQPDRAQGRGQKIAASAVKLIAQQHALPCYQPLNFRDPAAVAELQQLNPDVLIVAAYGLILPRSVLTIPRYGCINVHPSLLPRWRGAAPIEHSILQGDAETGVTIMQMNELLDAGDIILQQRCPITPTTTSGDLYQQLGANSVDLLLQTLSGIATLPRQVQDNELACYAPKINRGLTQLNWQLQAATLDCTIRAFDPHPGAFSYLGQEAVKIWRATVLNQTTTATPGQIIAVNKDSVNVASGNGVLSIMEIQFPGKKRLSIRDALNSQHTPLQVGACFHTQELN